MSFWLIFKRGPHGSGLNLTRSDVLEMEFDELSWYWKFLWEVWDEETKAGSAR